MLPLFTVVGMDRCEEDWYASDNILHGTLHGSRKKPSAGRSPTGRVSTAVLCRSPEKNGMVGAGHGRGMANVNQIRPHCVNQMGKTHSEPLAARHGRGRAWVRHATCESVFRTLPLDLTSVWRAICVHTFIIYFCDLLRGFRIFNATWKQRSVG